MPHTRLDRLTYTVHGTTEADIVAAARNRLTQTVTDPEQWQLAIDAATNDIDVSTFDEPHRHLWDWTATVVATRRPTPKPAKEQP